ncbi:MAG: hypothetical protein NT030_07700 [Candidatus Saganbacteria bacterium]|nr:hypothetical protein [Candidatus Saganbacteria bacterium]
MTYVLKSIPNKLGVINKLRYKICVKKYGLALHSWEKPGSINEAKVYFKKMDADILLGPGEMAAYNTETNEIDFNYFGIKERVGARYFKEVSEHELGHPTLHLPCSPLEWAKLREKANEQIRENVKNGLIKTFKIVLNERVEETSTDEVTDEMVEFLAHLSSNLFTDTVINTDLFLNSGSKIPKIYQKLSKSNISDLWKFYICSCESLWGISISKEKYMLSPEAEKDLVSLVEILRDAFEARKRLDIDYMAYQNKRYTAIVSKYFDPVAIKESFGIGDDISEHQIDPDLQEDLKDLSGAIRECESKSSSIPARSGKSLKRSLENMQRNNKEKSLKDIDQAIKEIENSLAKGSSSEKKVGSLAKKAAQSRGGGTGSLKEDLNELEKELASASRKGEEIENICEGIEKGLKEGNDKRIEQALKDLEDVSERENDPDLKKSSEEMQRDFYSGKKGELKDNANKLAEENKINPERQSEVIENIRDIENKNRKDYSKTSEKVIEQLKALSNSISPGREKKIKDLDTQLRNLEKQANGLLENNFSKEDKEKCEHEIKKLRKIEEKVKALEGKIRSQISKELKGTVQGLEDKKAKTDINKYDKDQLDNFNKVLDEIISKMQEASEGSDLSEMEGKIGEIMGQIHKKQTQKIPEELNKAMSEIQKKINGLKNMIKEFNPYKEIKDDIDYESKEKYEKVKSKIDRIKKLIGGLDLKNLADSIDEIKRKLQEAKKNQDKKLEKQMLDKIYEALKDLAEDLGLDAYREMMKELGVDGEMRKYESDIVQEINSSKTEKKDQGRGMSYGSSFRKPTQADIMYYRSVARKYEIKYHRIDSDEQLSGNGSYVKMPPDEAIRKLDVAATIFKSGSLIPPNWQMRQETNYIPDMSQEGGKDYPDLIIVIDSSGSMGVSHGKESEHITSGMIASHSAINVGREVVVINHSSGDWEVTFNKALTKNKDEADEALSGYFGGGTVFPHNTFKEAIGHIKNKKYFIYVTDTYIDVEETIKTLRKALELEKTDVEKRSVVGWSIFVEPVGGPPVEQVIERFKELGPTVYKASPKILRGKVLEIVTKHFSPGKVSLIS